VLSSVAHIYLTYSALSFYALCFHVLPCVPYNFPCVPYSFPVFPIVSRPGR
jgi:hypothetical protein